MKNLTVYSFSKSNTTRHIVIDHSVLIEEIATETIGRLLDIDWKLSKALGHSSGSLSFYQKISLIKDKVGVDSDKSRKIETFSQIRNKFSHLREIESWKDLFLLSSSYEKIERDLKKWYDSEEINEINHDDSTRVLYCHLTREVFYFLLQINVDWAYDKGKKVGENAVKTKLYELVKQKAEESKEVEKLWAEFKEALKSEKMTEEPNQELK